VKTFVDTNILVYANSNDHRQPRAQEILVSGLVRQQANRHGFTWLRHARAFHGHPREHCSGRKKTWMAGTGPAMTSAS
jgi:hypothetical protein